MPTKINYIEMPATDLAAAKTFYQAVFGWAFQDFGNDYVAFKKSGVLGGFYRSDQTMTTKSGSALVVLYHSDLVKIKNKIIQHGGNITIETFRFPGGQRFHFTDTCGNELSVWSDK